MIFLSFQVQAACQTDEHILAETPEQCLMEKHMMQIKQDNKPQFKTLYTFDGSDDVKFGECLRLKSTFYDIDQWFLTRVFNFSAL